MAIARSQMYRQLYGIGSLVDREKYGIGSKIKKGLQSVAKAIIPKELDPVLKIAAPFLGPVYGPIAAVAGSARSGKISPFTLAAAALPYMIRHKCWDIVALLSFLIVAGLPKVFS